MSGSKVFNRSSWFMEVYGVSLEPALNFLKVWREQLNTVRMDDSGTATLLLNP